MGAPLSRLPGGVYVDLGKETTETPSFWQGAGGAGPRGSQRSSTTEGDIVTSSNPSTPGRSARSGTSGPNST